MAGMVRDRRAIGVLNAPGINRCDRLTSRDVLVEVPADGRCRFDAIWAAQFTFWICRSMAVGVLWLVALRGRDIGDLGDCDVRCGVRMWPMVGTDTDRLPMLDKLNVDGCDRFNDSRMRVNCIS